MLQSYKHETSYRKLKYIFFLDLLQLGNKFYFRTGSVCFGYMESCILLERLKNVKPKTVIFLGKNSVWVTIITRCKLALQCRLYLCICGKIGLICVVSCLHFIFHLGLIWCFTSYIKFLAILKHSRFFKFFLRINPKLLLLILINPEIIRAWCIHKISLIILKYLF